MTYEQYREQMIAAASQHDTSVILGDQIADYQAEALRFAFYPKTYNESMRLIDRPCIPVYPALAMCGEAGEVCEKILGVAQPHEVVRELGDVLWYVAAAAEDLGLDLAAVAGVETWDEFQDDDRLLSDTPGSAIEDCALALVVVVGRFAEQHAKKPWRDGSPIDLRAAKECLRGVMVALAMLADEYGQTLRQVAQQNVDKLVDRRRRGTLKGSGDSR